MPTDPTDVRRSCLELHPIDVAEGERIVARRAGPTDSWADDFPFEGDVGAVGGFFRVTAEHGEQQPFDHRLSRVIADTTLDNVASQLVGTDDELHHDEAFLDTGHRLA